MIFLKVLFRFAISMIACTLLAVVVSKVFLGTVGMSAVYLGIAGGFVTAMSRIKSRNT
jgi:hypothetical protein